MKTVYPLLGRVSMALAMLAILSAGCKKNDDKQSGNAAVSITSFSPTEAAVGNTVVIYGKNFSDDKTKNAVTFNGISATVTDAKTVELSVTVPEGATNGKITVTVNEVTATSATDFKVNASTPQVSGFAPAKGITGMEVTITGQRFTNKSKVYFGDLPATTTFENSTTLKAIVPANVLTNKIKVKNDNLEAVSPTDFIAPPRITGLSAVRGDEGTLITITGVNFHVTKELNTVAFGNGQATAAEIESVTATEIKVKAPAAGKDGKVSVVVADLMGESSNDFLYNPIITDFSPKSGKKGTLVTLTGKRLGSSPAIEINGINAPLTFRATDQTEIRFNIPDNASVVGDKIKLKTKSNDYLTAVPFVVNNVWKKLHNAVAGQYYEKGFMFVQNNEILIGLGKNAAGALHETYKKYNTLANTWSAPISIPNTIVTPRYDVSYATLGDRAFVIGGLTGPTGFNRSVEFLNLTDGTWKTVEPLKTNSAGGVAYVIDNMLYAGMGNVGHSTSTYNISQFDNNNLTWTEQSFTDLHGAGNINNSCFVIGNKAYVGQGKNIANAQKQGFFAITGFITTEAVAPAPVTTEGASSFTFNGKGYVKAVHDLYEYDPAINEWKLINTTAGIYVNYLTTVNNRIFGIGYNGEVFEYIP